MTYVILKISFQRYISINFDVNTLKEKIEPKLTF